MPPEVLALRKAAPSIAVAPCVRGSGLWDLTPGSWVGTIQLGDLAIENRPRLGIDRVLFLLSCSRLAGAWREEEFAYTGADSLVEAIVPAFVA